MPTNSVRPSILQVCDAGVAELIAEDRGVSSLEGLRMFLSSETHRMLENDDLKMWHFSPAALFDMWESEQATGDPRDSIYLRGDEIG